MFDSKQLIEIVAGQKTGVLPRLIRLTLGSLTPVYRFGIWIRNRKFNRAIKTGNSSVVKQAGIPVISVGNLTTGGTGKTPLVIWISQWLRQKNIRVILISRGYTQSGHAGRNDEAIEMEDRLPDVPHLQDPDRHRMSQVAIEELESQLIILDDGFQHRQLHRNLDLVLIDATNPFGFGRLIPRGLLREPLSSLRRADLIIITRVNLVSEHELKTIHRSISRHAPEVDIAQTQTRFTKLIQVNGIEKPLDESEISHQPIFVFSGIGNPDNFVLALEEHRFQIGGQLTFADHHEYSRDDLQRIGEKAKQAGAQRILCTHKDLVKVGTSQLGGIPLFAILIDVEFVEGEKNLTDRLVQIAGLIQNS